MPLIPFSWNGYWPSPDTDFLNEYWPSLDTDFLNEYWPSLNTDFLNEYWPSLYTDLLNEYWPSLDTDFLSEYRRFLDKSYPWGKCRPTLDFMSRKRLLTISRENVLLFPDLITNNPWVALSPDLSIDHPWTLATLMKGGYRPTLEISRGKVDKIEMQIRIVGDRNYSTGI